ncbi:unnamed protein product [Rotaria socialis]|uniref:Uncharacterized protein n=1 Tax=Rotaria socialis TaxID=392032 RepID=A0A821JIK2_9BILA|nr:unnamed protein product [Rotaria socialis]
MLCRKEHIFRLDQHCATIRNAVLYTIQEYKIKTADIGSTSTTTQFIECALNGIVKMTSQIVFNYEIFGSDRIDFGTGAEIDWSDIHTVPELLDRALSSNAALNELTAKYFVFDFFKLVDDGIARGNDALTSFENRSQYPLFIH